MPMATNINSDIAQADAHDNDIDGGLDLKSDSASVAAPKTTRADNCWYTAPGLVKQLPAFATQLAGLAQAPLHVYNMHTREAVEGASSGDVMLHGEYRDTPGSTTDLFTSPLWAHNLGQTLNPSQPMLPYVARTRQLGAGTSPGTQTSYGINTFDANVNNVLTATQDIAGTDGRRRYAIVTNGFATVPGSAGSKTVGVTASFGYLDDQGEVIPSANAALLLAGTFTFLQAHALPGTTAWVLVYITSGLITYQRFDFAGNAVNAAVSFGGFTPAGAPQPFDVFQHNGQLYCVYLDKPTSTGNWQVYAYNVSTAAVVASPLIAGAATTLPTTPLCAFSPTPQTVTGTSYWGCVGLGKFAVAANNAAATNLTYAGPTRAASATGLNQATGAAVIFDTQGGVGANANLGFVSYRLFNEAVNTVSTGTAINADMQAVAIDRYNYAAATNTLTLVSTQVFRSSAGVQIAGKAFATNPGLASFAGPQAAKTVVCPLRIGSFDIPYAFGGSSKAPYGQPTYFLVDHQARIVGRWFDGAAPPGQFVATLPTALPTGLGQPIIHAPMSDMARVRIQVPSWSLIQAQYAPSVNVALTGSFVAPTNTPINPVFVPAVFDMQYQAQGVHVPAIRGGSHQYMSGCMTTLHDGRILTEANFHTAAFNPAVDSGTYQGSLGPAATYYYTVVYTWIDALGRKHRSQPSLVATATGVGNNGLFGGAGVVIAPPLGNKFASGNYVTCELYRSLSNATDGNSYLVGAAAVAPMGTALTPNNSTTSIVDNVYTDSYTPAGGTAIVGTLSAQPRLYTSINASSTANIYPASAPPPFCWMVATKGRAAGLAYVQGEARLYYSSVDSFGIPLEWNPFNYATIPGEIGEARSVEAIDDKFVILGTRANAVINGDGPPASNAAGIPSPGDGFSSVTPLPTPAGVLGTGCPVRIPAGVLYQGMTGITAIGRDLGLTPIGAPVDTLTGRQLGTVGQIYGRAMLLPSLQSVVWANASGPALVFNYMTSAWSTWPLLSYAQSLVQRLNGDIWVGLQPMTASAIPPASTAATGADVGVLSINTFAFNSPAPAGPAMVVETGWIAVGSTQAGQGWLREMALYGGYVGPHILQVEQGVDYQDYLPPMAWTVTSPPINYEYQLRPPSSSVRSMRYRITILPLTTLSAQYQTATLSDLALFSGSKQGTARLSGDASR